MNATSIRTRLIAAAALACAAAAPAYAGDFMARFRVLQLDPANQNTADAVITTDSVSVNTKYIWEIDASYFVTENVALELIATTPQKQTVYLNGTKLGTLRHLPPTLLLQYHFAPTNKAVRPYAGFGVNYTHFSAVNLNDVLPLDIDRHSWGTAVQFGADFPINDKVSINVDFKKIDIRTRVYNNGTQLGTVKVDPVLFGIGIGYRF
ncbi:MAG TPA: OmpW family outer membrane protein [Aquabacterium sp.]|uniref:OmpW/AlkL family protein n=1 Tax=Aquabacterium sp. TaxID=1872578 RepID=UPI002E34B8EF|nr:OmpW family outer membrane protein [Aquabacterium sp.]HEX5356894.1 OmpW family outer membrane protein [Aquabacterium sp.]